MIEIIKRNKVLLLLILLVSIIILITFSLVDWSQDTDKIPARGVYVLCGL